jgi:hypothetical protein
MVVALVLLRIASKGADGEKRESCQNTLDFTAKSTLFIGANRMFPLTPQPPQRRLFWPPSTVYQKPVVGLSYSYL